MDMSKILGFVVLALLVIAVMYCTTFTRPIISGLVTKIPVAGSKIDGIASKLPQAF